MKSTKYLPLLRALEQRKQGQIKHRKATLGERIFASLFPSRGVGWPGGWSQNRVEQSMHMRNWVYCCIDLICSKKASITPNIAYVSNEPIPGRTEKACHRTVGRYGGTWDLSDSDTLRSPESSGRFKSAHWDQRADSLRQRAPFSSGYSPGVGFTDGGHSWLTMGAYRSKALSVVKPHEELEPIEADHPLRELVDNPNPFDTQFDIEYELQMFEELMGVSYEWIIPNEYGKPLERWCLPSHWVWPKTGGGRYPDSRYIDSDKLIWYYEVRPWGGTYGSAGLLRIPPEEIIMTRWPSPINKIDGYARLAAIAQWIDSEESISLSRWAQFQNIARPELVIKLGPGYEDPDDDRIERLLAKIASAHQGESSYGLPLVLPPGADATPTSYSPTEMAYFQSEEQVRDMICSTWRVPPAALGIVKEMTYGSILAILGGLCSMCLNPRLIRRGQVLTKGLASRWDEQRPAWGSGADFSDGKAYGYGRGGNGHGQTRKVKLWYDDCVPADPQQVNSDIGVDLQGYAITPSEIRALRGRKAYGNGGNNPIVTGPGGPMPLPLNEEENVDDLTQIIQQMQQASQPQQGGEGGEQQPGLPGAEAEGEASPPVAGDTEVPTPTGEGESPWHTPDTDLAEDAGPPEEPNGPPQKSVNPNTLRVGDKVRSFNNLIGEVIDFGQYRDLKTRYPHATVVRSEDADESKFGRCWVVKWQSGETNLMGSLALRLFLNPVKGYDDTLTALAHSFLQEKRAKRRARQQSNGHVKEPVV